MWDSYQHTRKGSEKRITINASKKQHQIIFRYLPLLLTKEQMWPHIFCKKKWSREKEDTNICHSFSYHFGCGRGIKRESLLKHFFLLLTSSSCWNWRQSDLETDKTRTTARWSLCVNIDHYWGYFAPKWHFPNLVTWWFS